MKNIRFLLAFILLTSTSFFSCDYDFPTDEMVGTWYMSGIVIPDGDLDKTIHNGDTEWESLASAFGFKKMIIEDNLTYTYIGYWDDTAVYTWERLDEETVRLWKGTNSMNIIRDDATHYTFYKKDDVNLLEVKWTKQ